MKLKILVVAVLSVLGSSLAAQERNFEKGKFIVGINGSGGYGKGSFSTNYNLSVSPWVGYFVAKNLAAGVRLTYGENALDAKNGSNAISEFKNHTVAPELFVRYYAPKIKIKPFVQVGGGYRFLKGTVPDLAFGKLKTSNVIGSVEGGILFPIGKRFAIEPSYNFRFQSSKAINSNEKGSLRLGVSYRF